LEGNYRITVKENDVITFSAVGFVTQELEVGKQSVIDINLAVNISQLEEVVITGYTAQSKHNISGAVSVVDPEEIKNVPMSSVQGQLQGRAPGVDVIYSGQPGEVPMVRIRGIGTIRVRDEDAPFFSDYNDPLFIIDGMSADSFTAFNMNPNDIESIQILKDASAASIYGVRAANGVIIMTSKLGQKTKGTTLFFDSYIGIEQGFRLPDLLNPDELAMTIKERQLNSGWDLSHPQYLLSDSTWGLPDYIIPAGHSIALDGEIDESEYDLYEYPITKANKEGTDWFDEIMQPGIIQNYNLGVSGASDIGKFYLSTGYFNQEGIIKHTGYDKFTVRINSEYNIHKKLRMGERLNFTYNVFSNADGEIAIEDARISQKIIPIYDIRGNYAEAKAQGGIGGGNPVRYLEKAKSNKSKLINLSGSLYLEWDILDELIFKSNFSPKFNVTIENKKFSPTSLVFYPQIMPNSLDQNSYNFMSWTWYNTLAFQKTFGEAHHFNLLAGMEAINESYTGMGASRSEFYSEDLSYRHLNAGEEGISNWGYATEASLFSLFTKLDYNYRGKYIVSGTIRRDGSSRFESDNRYGVFPALSIAWRISCERFMQGLSFINDLKLRIGWGQTGNQDIGEYNIFRTYGIDLPFASYDIHGQQYSVHKGFDATTFGNPEAKWETTTTSNIGLNLALFNSSFIIDFDFYSRITSDMLMIKRQPSTRGIAEYPWANIGEIKNEGFDLGINYRGPKYGKFNWSIGANISHYRNEVVKLNYSDEIIINTVTVRGWPINATTVTQVGYPIGSFYGYNILGIFQNEEEVKGHASQDGAAPGRWKFEDINQDSVINDLDRKILGSPHPDFTFGIPIDFTYKNINLNLFWYGSYGNDIFNHNKFMTDLGGFGGNPYGQQGRRILSSWSRPGVDPAEATIPLLVMTAPQNEGSLTNYLIENGSYLRLSQLTLEYNFVTEKWKSVNKFKIYLQVNNVFTITNYEGIDPMVRGDNELMLGIDSSTYPVVRSFIIGFNISL
jgi:TonB-linked SusC/RagA family outer membrane protein